MDNPLEQMLRLAYQQFAQGDLEGYLSHCTPDITFSVPGKGKMAGTYTRAQFVTPFISRVMEVSKGTFREEVLDVVANERRAAVFARHSMEVNGKSFTYETAHHYRIEGGKLAEFVEAPADLYAFDEAWE